MGQILLMVLVFLPLISAAAAYPLGRRAPRGRDALVLAVTAAELACAAALLLFPAAEGGCAAVCGLGVRFSAGSLRTVLAVLAAFLWLMTTLVSPEYFAGAARTERYYSFLLFTLGALEGVFLAGDLFTLFIFFELMSFTSYVWVVQNETPAALRASETYLYIAVIGGLAMLMGLFLLYHAAGTLELQALRAAAAAGTIPDGTLFAAGLCVLTGFGAKAGMFPLHIWLPKAHPVAPAPASALLSGILTKSGLFGILAVTCGLFEGNVRWGGLLLTLGTVTMVLGAVLAVFSTDLKRTLACSSMSQIGFILVGAAMAGLLGKEGGLAVWGAVLHVLNHSLIKLVLFVAAGVVYCNAHALELNDIRGFGRGKPVLLLAFLSGGCSISGIPGFGGYVSKTLLHESIVEYAALLSERGQSAAAIGAVEWLFLFSGGLTFAYMLRLFVILFLRKPPAGQRQKTPVMGRPTAAVLLLGAALLPLLGLTAYGSMERIAAYAAGFLYSDGPAHAVHYFAWENLKGAAISVSVGLAVYFLVGRLWLTRRQTGEERYRAVWPAWLDLEDSVYRPLLRLLAFLGAAAARLLASVGSWAIYGALNLLYYKAEREVRPPENKYFGRYGEKKRRIIVGETFSYDLLVAGLGLAAMLAYLMTRL